MLLEKSVIFLSILVSYFLQTSVGFFSLRDIKPDFLLILTIYFAIFRGSFWGLWIGFLGGLLQDINLGNFLALDTNQLKYYIGINALPKTLIGYFTGRIASSINKDGNIMPFVIVLVASLVKGFLVFFEIAIFQDQIPSRAIISIIIPEAIYNAFIAIFWFRILKWTLPQLETNKFY